jgi:N-acetylmuramoyl-L-alanine amidase
LAQTATIAASLEIGDALLQEFTSITHLHSQRVEQAAFVVLKSPDIPSLLVETGFISDPYTENKLRDASYQQKIANCMARGITEYFMRRPPQGTYLKGKHK